jgi:hypothetical protein
MSSGIAALIAHAAFWALIMCGWWLGELRWRGTAIVLALWIAAYVCRSALPDGGSYFPPFVAALDVALVFAIFKGDVRLS